MHTDTPDSQQAGETLAGVATGEYIVVNTDGNDCIVGYVNRISSAEKTYRWEDAALFLEGPVINGPDRASRFKIQVSCIEGQWDSADISLFLPHTTYAKNGATRRESYGVPVAVHVHDTHILDAETEHFDIAEQRQ